jgi:hypothetical protein
MIAGTNITHFANEDRGFRQWASENARGYVLTDPSPDALTLHFAFCLLLHDRGTSDVTVNEKVCALGRHDLIQFSFEELGKAPARCKTCNP